LTDRIRQVANNAKNDPQVTDQKWNQGVTPMEALKASAGK
jgi:hypothetical protein